MTNELMFIDEHSVEVHADREAVWKALTRSFGSTKGSGVFTLYARAIAADPGSNKGELDQVGSTRVGFRVSDVDAPALLVLTGTHRFASYSLTWKVVAATDGTSRLSAITHAGFPGVRGRVYKALVIGSGIHGQVTRRMLSSVARRASGS